MTTKESVEFLSLINDLPGFVYRCRNNKNWTMLYLSDQVEGITGYTREELQQGGNQSYGDIIHPNDREHVWDKVQQAVRDGESFQVVYRIRTKGGSERWLWEQGRGIRDDNDQLEYLQGFIQDITDQKQTREEKALFQRISKQISSSSDYTEAVRTILREIAHTTGWDFGELWLVDSENEETIHAEVHYNPENGQLESYWKDSQAVTFTKGKGIVGRVWQNGRIEWDEQISDDGRGIRAEIANQAGLDTALGVPCIADDEVIGVFVIYLKQKHKKDERTIELMKTMGEQIGSLLKQKKLDSELARKKNLQEQILTNLQTDIWMIDLEFEEFVYTNPAFDETWGDYFDGVDDIREAFLEAVHPDDRERIRSNIMGTDVHQYQHDFRLHRPTDGELCWYRDHAFVIRNENGDPYRIVGLGENITKEKQANMQLKEALEEKKTLLQELHHRVKNNLQTILGLIGIQKRTLSNDTPTEIRMEKLRNRVQSIGLIHKLLYRQSKYYELECDDYFEELINKILKSMKPASLELRTTVEIDPVTINVNRLKPLGLILNELLTNAIQHGLKHADEGEISIRLKEESSDDLSLQVSDNGRGLDEDTSLEDLSSVGWELVNNLVDQLRGELRVFQEDGLTVEITISGDGDSD